MPVDRARVLAPPKHLTRDTLDDFKAKVEPLFGSELSGIVIDMTTTEFLNSTGLGYLVHIGKTLSEQGARIALASPSAPVERMIRMVGLDQMLPIYRSIDAAVAYVDGTA